MRRKRLLLIGCVCLLFYACLVSVSALEANGLDNFAQQSKPVPAFTDVGNYEWFNPYVQAVAMKGLMVGNSASTFNPHGNVTLAETVTIAARLHSIYFNGEEDFQQGTVWYQVYLDYAEKNGIKVIKASDYNRKATRGEFAQIIASAFPTEALTEINALSNNAVPDVTLGMSCGDAVYTLYRAGVLTGNDAMGTFAPFSNIKRSEVAAIISRMVNPEERIVLNWSASEEQLKDEEQLLPETPKDEQEEQPEQKPAVTDPTVVVQSVEAKAGQSQVAVTVSVKNNPGIAAMGLNLSYDSALTLNSVVYNDQLPGETMRPQSMKNPVKLLWLNPFENVSEDFVLATIYFEVSGSATGSHQVAVTYDPNNVYDISENNVHFEIVQGAVLVK